MQQVKVYSTFVRPMQVTRIAPVNKDNRIKYIPLEEASMPIITRGENYIGSVRIEPSVTCKHHCYLGLSLYSNGKHETFTRRDIQNERTRLALRPLKSAFNATDILARKSARIDTV